MMSLVETRGLRWILLFLLWAVIPLHGQDDAGEARLWTSCKRASFMMLKCCGANWKSAIRTTPTIHSNLGVALAQQGQFEPATVEYRKSLALNPRQPEVAFNLGVAEFKQGHFQQAIPAFKTVAKLKPDDTRSTLLLGMSYYGLRQYALANSVSAAGKPE